jgi:hypothetical protein
MRTLAYLNAAQIADIIRERRDFVTNPASQALCDKLAAEFANRLAAVDPQLNVGAFLVACGALEA